MCCGDCSCSLGARGGPEVRQVGQALRHGVVARPALIPVIVHERRIDRGALLDARRVGVLLRARIVRRVFEGRRFFGAERRSIRRFLELSEFGVRGLVLEGVRNGFEKRTESHENDEKTKKRGHHTIDYTEDAVPLSN